MLVVSRFTVDAGETAFAEQAATALAVLSQRPGYLAGRVARAADDEREWLVVTEWTGAGAWRRALSSYDVKVVATPLLARGRDEVSVYELVVELPAPPAGTERGSRVSDAAR